MASIKQKLTPCLWFDTQAEEAANFYTSIFANSRIEQVSRYSKAGHDVHGKAPGSVMMVEFELEGQTFTALNGGPQFKFSEAISFQVSCDGQDEIDRFWEKLSDGGEEGPCGWLKDRYGLSWQIVPSALPQLIAQSGGAALDRVMSAVMKMKKFDIEALKRVSTKHGRLHACAQRLRDQRHLDHAGPAAVHGQADGGFHELRQHDRQPIRTGPQQAQEAR
jgi:predicted 3-demethylubiquinone-9 3-methyltransferase (glyoxalase superfamily)